MMKPIALGRAKNSGASQKKFSFLSAGKAPKLAQKRTRVYSLTRSYWWHVLVTRYARVIVVVDVKTLFRYWRYVLLFYQQN